MAQLHVEGRPRHALIEEAIAAIQKDPSGALRKEYFGIKNYAAFGDQREDHSYGFGPKHGSIVFRIGRRDQFLADGKVLDEDAIYYLEAYRDFGTLDWADSGRVVALDLCSVIRRHDELSLQLNTLTQALDRTAVHEHVSVA